HLLRRSVLPRKFRGAPRSPEQRCSLLWLPPEDAMRRTCLWVAAGGAALVLAVFMRQASTTGAQDQNNGNGPKKADGPLTIRQIVLFNSGVGYFQREGDVDGNAQIELAFPTSDINDLLKSLILQDLGGGKISTVSYD